MQIVIDITDEMWQAVQDGWVGNELWHSALENGIPIPKGHGDMTREEHISNLETIGCDGLTVTTEAYKSLQFAIKALEQEPCEDCISRQAATPACKEVQA